MTSVPQVSPRIHLVTEDTESYDATPRFTMIPDAVRALNDGYCLAVYEAIARYADHQTGEAYPSIKTICEHTGWSKPHVLKSIKKLINAGIINREERFINGMSRSNLYRINANVQVSTTVTAVSTTDTLGVNHVYSGGKPGLHELDSVELDSVEQQGLPPIGPPPKSSSRRKPEIPIPDDFAPTEEMVSRACEKHHVTREWIEAKTDTFKLWAVEKDRRYVNWNAVWTRFMEPKPWDQPTNGHRPGSTGNRGKDLVAAAMRNIEKQRAGLDQDTNVIDVAFTEEHHANTPERRIGLDQLLSLNRGNGGNR